MMALVYGEQRTPIPQKGETPPTQGPYNIKEGIEIGQAYICTLVSRNRAHHGDQFRAGVAVRIEEKCVLDDGEEIAAAA
jgi:hypothetical protein